MVAIHSQTFDQIDLKYQNIIISLAWHMEKLFVTRRAALYNVLYYCTNYYFLQGSYIPL